jgi:hypothetical protein
MFVASDRSPNGILEVLHGFHRFPEVQGKADRERKQVFCYGGVIGVDLRTVAFDGDQLETTTAVNVPASIEWVLQLLGEEPTWETIGLFRVGEANVRIVTSTRQAVYRVNRQESLRVVTVGQHQRWHVMACNRYVRSWWITWWWG